MASFEKTNGYMESLIPFAVSVLVSVSAFNHINLIKFLLEQ